MTEICRTCLQEVGDSSVIFYLDAVESHLETITIRCKLADCVPEMDLDVVPNAFICNSCFESLTVAHEFKNKCLETEGRIQSYIEQMGYVLTSVDLREIVQQGKTQPPGEIKPSSSKPDFSTFLQPLGYAPKDSSHEKARTTLYDTNKNPIDPFFIKQEQHRKEEPKEKSLDLKNLQCDTRAFFAVPKIAQLLAEGHKSSLKCSQCSYKASSDIDLKSHEEIHLSQTLQKCDTQDFFPTPKIAQLLAEGNGTSYTCSQCGYMASGDLDLKSHEKTHLLSQTLQKCDTQDFFATPKIAQLLSEGNGTPYKCTQCTYVASSDLDLKSHEENHFTQKLHKCTECNYSAPKRQTLIIHMRKHSEEKPYHCTECGYSTPYRTTLVQHLRTHTGDRLYKCTLCDFSSVYSSALSKHIQMHIEDKPFQCELCNYKGRLKFDLKTHMRVHTGEKPYKCLLCDYCSSHKTNLSYHMRIHTGEKPYKCKMCDYRSSQKANLQNHMKTHTGDKLFKCTQCSYTTAHGKSLTAHMRIHSEEKSYSCTFCNYQSSTKINLIKHITTHAGEKPFQCFDCNYKTETKTDLERHMSIHSSEKPFICSACRKSFGNEDNLKRHMKHHTGDRAGSPQPSTSSNTSATTHSSASISETGAADIGTDFQRNQDKNNCESAVKKEMII